MPLIATNDERIIQLIKDPNYYINKEGQIWTCIARTGKVTKKFWRLISKNSIQNGYFVIKYKYKHVYLHRIIYYKFYNKLNKSLVINHIDGNRKNNNIANLEMVTNQENLLHGYRVLKNKAVIGHFKISYDIANTIRQEFHSGTRQFVLVKKYSLSKSNISNIVNNKIWVDNNE